MRPLSAWPLSRVIGVVVAWTPIAFVVAFLTPPGRFLLWLNTTLRAGGDVQVDVPVTALKVWFVVVPILAFGPPAAVLIAWLRARGVGAGKGAD